MKCPKCKINLSKDAKFCSECGAHVPKPIRETQKSKEFPPILNVTQAAEFLGVSRAQLYILINKHDLPWFPIGTHKRFIADELVAWLKRQSRAV